MVKPIVPAARGMILSQASFGLGSGNHRGVGRLRQGLGGRHRGAPAPSRAQPLRLLADGPEPRLPEPGRDQGSVTVSVTGEAGEG